LSSDLSPDIIASLASTGVKTADETPPGMTARRSFDHSTIAIRSISFLGEVFLANEAYSARLMGKLAPSFEIRLTSEPS
jgi:hypothetical protein